MDGRSKPWASLKVLSSAKSAKSLPTFFEKENINGTLELNADKCDSIQAITASVKGRILTGANADDSYTFLDLTHPIWSRSPTDPRVPSLSEGANSTKLHGHCVWPLSIPIPKVVSIPTGDAPQLFHLPETFLERHAGASIQYDLTVRISRGKLRSDSQIRTPFGYVPSTRPNPPSIPRQQAYLGNFPLPGPETDPEGWKTLKPVVVRGLMFKTRRAEAKCTLSLAKPLCYTRGTVIPCILTLEGRDSQALDMLSTPSSVVVCLRRHVKYYNSPSSISRLNVAWKDSFEDVASAVWWPSGTSRSNPCTRHLEGEIRLAKDLRPSSAIAHFSITYSVVLCAFDVAGYSSIDSGPLLAEPVEIATMHAKGPRPKVYSPPAYDPISRENREFYAPPRGMIIVG